MIIHSNEIHVHNTMLWIFSVSKFLFYSNEGYVQNTMGWIFSGIFCFIQWKSCSQYDGLDLFSDALFYSNEVHVHNTGMSWPWLYGSWIYNYLCNQCLLPLMLLVRISIRVTCTTLCDKFCQWLATGWWFSPGPPVSSTNITDRHEITEILLKVALNTIKQTNKHVHNTMVWIFSVVFCFIQRKFKFGIQWFISCSWFSFFVVVFILIGPQMKLLVKHRAC